MKGYFISVEGGDGSGKSTQMQRIEAYLTEMGQEVLLTREPGGTPMAEKIREMILDPANRDLSGRAEMLLYAAARAQHVEEKILPALRAGKTVLSDRFTDSSIAYQGFGRGLGDMVAEVNHIATGGVEPELTIFLNITPAAGMARKNRQDGHVARKTDRTMCLTVWSRKRRHFMKRCMQAICSLRRKTAQELRILMRTDLPRPSLRISEKR